MRTIESPFSQNVLTHGRTLDAKTATRKSRHPKQVKAVRLDRGAARTTSFRGPNEPSAIHKIDRRQVQTRCDFKRLATTGIAEARCVGHVPIPPAPEHEVGDGRQTEREVTGNRQCL